jgi:hypothetical protein
MYRQKRSMEARMSSADLFHQNDLASALCRSMNFSQHPSGALDRVGVNAWRLRRPFLGPSVFDCVQDHEMLLHDGERDGSFSLLQLQASSSVASRPFGGR